VKKPADEVLLPVLVAFLIATQKTIAVSLPVDVSAAKDRTVTIGPVSVKA
jgi:hypothetical protein